MRVANSRVCFRVLVDFHVYEHRFWQAFAIYFCVRLQQAHRRIFVLRAAKSKHC